MNDPNPLKPRRRWYQFSTRTLLLVVLVAVIGIGWYGSKLQQIRKRQRAADEVLAVAARIENLGGKVVWRKTSGVTPEWLRDNPYGYSNDAGVYCIEIVVLPQATDDDLKQLLESNQLTFIELDLSSSQVSDDGLNNLTGLSNLRVLRLDGTNVTDDGANRLQEFLPNLRIIPSPENLAAIANLKQLGGAVKIFSDASYPYSILNGRKFYHASQQSWHANRRLYANRGLYVNLSQANIADADLVQIERLAHPLYSIMLVLRDRPITDTGLGHLETLTGLQHLVLAGTQVSDVGLEHLTGHSELVELDLKGTRVSDVGMEQITALSGLVWLDFADTRVTDAGLQHLERLTKLKHLDVRNTKVTEEGVKKLQQALPNCKMSY